MDCAWERDTVPPIIHSLPRLPILLYAVTLLLHTTYARHLNTIFSSRHKNGRMHSGGFPFCAGILLAFPRHDGISARWHLGTLMKKKKKKIGHGHHGECEPTQTPRTPTRACIISRVRISLPGKPGSHIGLVVLHRQDRRLLRLSLCGLVIFFFFPTRRYQASRLLRYLLET